MIKNQIIIAFRNLVRQKGYSVLNISGLAIGIAVCILIVLYVSDELSYDRYHEKANRTYRVATHGVIGPNEFKLAVSPAPMAGTFVREYPEVEASVRIRNYGFPVIRYEDKIFSEERFFWADSTIFDIFTIPLLQGNPKTALNKPESVVITQSTAQKYFGDEDPMGKLLNSDNRRDYMVTGVVKDPPHNSHFHFDFLGSLSSYRDQLDDIWLSNNFYTYLLFRDETSAAEFEKKIPDIVAQYAGPQIQEATGYSFEQMLQSGNTYTWLLQPLTDIHLHSALEHELEPNGNADYVYIFALVALAILVIASINFMNLSTARSARRAREVGMRKTLGSNQAQIVSQFLIESIFFTAIAVGIALILVEFALPFYNMLTGKQLNLTYLDRINTIPLLILFTITVGIFAGSYPAFFLASFKPIKVLKGKLQAGSGAHRFLRSGLVIFQFAISVALISGTIIVFNQLKYIQDKNLGFNKDQLVIVEKTDDIGQQIKSFKYELQKDPSVKSVTNSTHYLGQNMSSNAFRPDDPNNPQTYIIWNLWSDYNFVETYEIKMLQGRFYSDEFKTDSFAVVMNEAAVKALGIIDPIGKHVIRVGTNPENAQKLHIIGVMKDFHFESLHNEIRPLFVLPFRQDGFGRYTTVKLSGSDFGSSLQNLESIWHKFAGNQAFEYSFFDQEFARLYAAEQRTGKLMLIFTALTIIVACLGLFGLASFTAEQRTKEVGVRKVLGATVPGIIMILSRDIVKLIFFANLLALPAVYYLMLGWLENYAYRTEPGLVVFIGSALLSFAIAIITVSYQAYKSATANPVQALRYE